MLPALKFEAIICEEGNSESLFCLGLAKPLLLSLSLFLSAGITTFAQSSVTTQHYDIARTGANTNEAILAPTNVNTSMFGKLFSNPVDGWVYAQPLYMPGVTMGAGTAQAGTTHNVVFVATEHDSVFAFDADSNTGANASPLWRVSLIDAAHGGNPAAGEKTVPSADVSYNPPDITPEIGITSTPVIDPTTNTIYVVAKSTIGDTQFYQRLHALDITTGAEKFGGPVTLSASVAGTGNGSSGGTLNWDPKWENNRASLLLLNGIVYIGFGSHMDQGPWHGWILAYNASTLQQTGVWCASPNAAAGGIWMGGTGLAADVPSGKPYGRMFTVTGNGTFDAVSPNYTNAMDYGDSIIKLDLANGVPTMLSGTTTVGDDFTPYNQETLNNNDSDQASGGVVLLPDSVGGGGHQLVQVGKSGIVYVLNRENLGGYNPNNTTDPGTSATVGGLWGAPAYWNGNVYVWGVSGHLKAFTFANGAFTSSTPSSQSAETAGTYSPTPTISANGTTNGIVWSLKTDNYGSQGPEILYAHDATNVGTLLYSSAQNSTRDNPGNSVKFIVPTVMNGKVYVGSESQLSVFGLLNGATQAATPAISPASQTFNPSIQVTITDTTSGATIYYTTDGSTPTPASTKYTTPFTLTTTSTVNAMAAGTGLLASPVASATYTLTTQVVTPTFTPPPGTYATVQSVTITTTTPNATIYYTTDGTTPTTSSSKYTGPVSVGATETLSAIAVASGLSNSPLLSGLYTIDLAGVSSINFSSGFTAGTMNLLGSAKLNGAALELTDGGSNEAAAAWYQVEANVDSFTTDFTFQITAPSSSTTADGLTFTIQGSTASAIGDLGGSLGYGTPSGSGIGSSVAVKFDLYGNDGEGTDSTGLYTNGAWPTVPFVDMTGSGVNLHSGDPFHVHMSYDGTNLAMTITDTTTNASFSYTWPVDIPTIVDGDSAYVGFTGGTGGLTAIQSILNWTFVATGGQATTTPTFSPAAGTYLGTQTVTINDATSGATIYYTTDGTTPTTSSTQYTSPITVTSTETINAIAATASNPASAVGTATYTIESQVAAPAFSPAAGTYSSPQTVTISTTSPGAAIYYTTNGTTPTTSSTQYTAPITVSATTTIQAIAVLSGFFDSNVATATYTITSGGTTVINLGSGFTAGAMTLNGHATLTGTRLRLTDGGTNEASSAWYGSAVNIQQFTTNFSFQITGGTNPTADGFAFVIQGGPSSALGPGGGGLGYGPDNPAGTGGIPNSVAVKFDLYSNNGEGPDSTGLYTDGASPTTPAVDMTGSGVNLQTTDVFNVQISYDGTTLTMTITDATTNATFTHAWPISIPTTVGGNTALVGFTGGTGGLTAIQEIIGWTLSSTTGVAATPTFSPAAGTYATAQTVTISDATSGATIYYTTNGTTPTTSSTQYTAPVSVSTTETIEAIAVASGYSQSAVGSATYTITSVAATPTFSPAAGTYTTAQTVTISDATSGATIYYTTNGTTPTTSSTKYTAPVSVSTTETIEAIAVASGYSQSAVGSATYTITPVAATPTFSPAAGTYATAQTVTISDATSGATIYYTTNGTTPTTSSTKYTAPVSVSTTETIEAIAVASGYSQSAVGSAAYTITSGGPTVINLGSGFTAGAMTLNGHATLTGTRLRLTDGGTNEASSAWYGSAVNIQQFTTNFSFQITGGTNPTADGFAFVIQGGPSSALGTLGGGLGYGATTAGTGGIPNSVAVKFDLYSNNREGPDSTGLYTDGASPMTPAVDMTGSGVNLHTTDVFNVQISYDGTTLTMTITDATTNATFTHAWPINIPTTVGGNTALVGFTGGTGGLTAIQEIIGWTLSSTTGVAAAATPTFSPAAGTYATAQTVTISDATSGATIYYTTNGTTPTTSSTKYTAPVSVSTTETIEAIAVASGYSQSAVGSATYTITPVAATPTFSPAAGTYATAQTVTISDATSGATIYYTTNGTTPTTSSTKYTAPVSVSTTETIEAIAVASGYSQSAVGSAAYTITSGGPTVINLGSGFTAGAMTLNGHATLTGTRLRLTDGGTNEASSAWYGSAVNIQQFTTNFSFQITGGTNPTADGFAFVIQGGPSSALGTLGGGLGYGATTAGTGGIPNSVAVKFDLYSNNREGPDSTGLYTDGASPMTPAVDMTGSGVNLHTTDVFNVQISYDGTTLTMTITDATTNATFTHAWPINIPTTVGGNTALVGFTGGTGGLTAIQEIIGWTLE